MMKLLFTICLFFAVSTTISAQNIINWDNTYQLKLSDFRSPATEIGTVSVNGLNTAATIDFAFQMSNMEFLFTKNFNPKVSCSFNRNASSVLAVDSATAIALLNFARYQFDLSELYARKFRKKLHDNKGVFSSAAFFKPVFDSIKQAFTERATSAQKETCMGMDSTRLKALHDQVRQEITALSGYCKECKPPKKKKHRRK